MRFRVVMCKMGYTELRFNIYVVPIQISLTKYLYLYIYIYIFLSIFIHIFIHIFICIFIYLFIYLFIFISDDFNDKLYTH